MEKSSKENISKTLQSYMARMMKKFSPEKIANTFSGETSSASTESLNEENNDSKINPVKSKKNKSFFTSVSSENSQRIRIGDGIATIASKIYSLFSKRDSEEKKKLEIIKDFEHERNFELKKEYDNILDSVGPEDNLNKTATKTTIKKSSLLKKAAIATTGVAGAASIDSFLFPQKSENEESGETDIDPKHSHVETPETNTQSETEKPTYAIQPFSKESYKAYLREHETPDSYDPYNTMNKSKEEYKRKSNSNIITTENTDINGKKYTKNLTDMTLQEVVDFSEHRKKKIGAAGMGGASGKYQLMSIAIKEVGPIAFGKEWKKQKFSPENQELLMDALTDYQTKRLKSQGLDVNNASLYLMHVFGNPHKASRIIKAKDDQLMKDVMNSSEAEANPSIAKMTVKDYKTKIGMSSDGKALPTKVSAKNVSMSRGFKPGHDGIDYAATAGTSVNATKDGKVVQASMNPPGFNGYGNLVVLDHGDGTQSLYAHLSSFNVSVGDNVKQGQNLGGVGSTGKSTGNHLHYEIRKNGKAIDPETNKLSMVSPVGNTTSLAQTEQTGNVLENKLEENKSLKSKNNMVSINNPTNNVVGKKQENQILTTGSLNDLPLIPKFVLPNNTQLS